MLLPIALALLTASAHVADHKADVRLHRAVLAGDATKAAAALKDGANPEATIGRESIALEAVRLHDAGVLRALKDGGVKFDTVTADGWNIMNLALLERDCDPEVVRLALEAGAMPDRKRCPAGAVATVAACNNTRIATMLIDAGGTIDRFDDQDYSVLDCAVQVGSAEVVTLLLQKNANAEAMPKCGWTVWHCLAQRPRGDKETAAVAKALKGVSDPDGESLDQWTPLMYACYRNSLESVKALVDAGASVDGERGGYAVVTAAMYANEDILKYLLDKGAPVEADWSGLSPVAAVFYGSDPMLSAGMMRRPGPAGDPTENLLRMMRGNPLEKLRLLIAKGADVSSPDGSEWTPLDLAARVWDETYSAQPDAAKVLLERASTRRATREDRAGSEAVAYFRSLDPVAAARLLLDAGATVEIENDINPIEVAGTRLDSRRKPLLELLRAHLKQK